MEPIDFLMTAQESAQGQREVDYRNAASRAYYSAFHLCKGLATSFPIGTSHEKVILALTEHPDKRIKSLGNTLKQLKNIRVHADYKLEKPFPASEARKVVKIVNKIPERIAELQTGSH